MKLEAERGIDATRVYDSKVDVWAVGILAYELLIGRPPFEVAEQRMTAERIARCEDIHYPCYISSPAQDFVRSVSRKD
eukprot:scaffold155494_cov45-Prasinocladus_malaysianus.AAC.1